ncbi:MAG: metallophosphoesterase [Planctomycetia bacterium]|nr:metallophosphoesterase [Planctomycetia bacterium]
MNVWCSNRLFRVCSVLCVLLAWGGLSPWIATAESVPVDENLLVLVSDTHIHHEGPIVVNENLQFDSVALFKRVVDDVLRMNPRPAAVLIMGDLIHQGTADTPYEMLREILRPWDEAGIPYYLALGNHDQPPRFFKIFPEWKEKMVPGCCAWKASFKNIDFLVLETTDYSNGWYGIHPKVQKEWLDAQLARQTRPVFVCGHHDWELMREKPALKNPHVQGWICGHRHDFLTKTYPDGVRELRIPTTAHAMIPNSGYLLMRVTEDGYRFTFVPLRDDSHDTGKEIFLKRI